MSFLARWVLQLASLVYWGCVKLVCALVRIVGPVPKHVAFIMDGNRRYGQIHRLQDNQGHEEGYKKLIEVVKWCLQLGVQHISVYAFSIDNFKRSQGEVEFLMLQAERKYKEMILENGIAARYGVEVRVVGDLTLTPPAVQQAAQRVMAASAAVPRKHAILNICFAYTSSHEMAAAVAACQQRVRTGEVHRADVSLRTFHDALLTHGSPRVDMLVRTSGETRLSDFMLWQCRVAQLVWVPDLWPDFGFAAFVRCVLRYQLAAQDLGAVRAAVERSESAAVERHRQACCSGGAAHGGSAVDGCEAARVQHLDGNLCTEPKAEQSCAYRRNGEKPACNVGS